MKTPESIMNDATTNMAESLAQARERELVVFLAEYNLTPQNMKRNGYELVFEKNGEREAWKLCKVVMQRAYKFTVDIDTPTHSVS